MTLFTHEYQGKGFMRSWTFQALLFGVLQVGMVEAQVPVSGASILNAHLSDDFMVAPQMPADSLTLPGGAKMDFVWISPGTFQMGSSSLNASKDEQPHQVQLTKGFYLGTYEVTQEQWKAEMGTSPWLSKPFATGVKDGPKFPALGLSWNDVQDFIQKLNQAAGTTLVRLPTEAEWEYACRAGTTTDWSFGDQYSQLGNYAWFVRNTGTTTLLQGTVQVTEFWPHEVGTRLPNPWGLYDMHGNVLEWVQDWYDDYPPSMQIDPTGPKSGSVHVLRSSGFSEDVRNTRSATRHGAKEVIARDGHVFCGLRLVMNGNSP